MKQKIMSMYTDPLHIQVSDPGHLEGNTVFTYLDAFCEDEDFAAFLPEYANLQELKDHYTHGGLGDVKVKRFLMAVMEKLLKPIRERRADYEKNLDAVVEILKKGTEAAENEAAQTLSDVRKAMKINYFDSNILINSYLEK